MIVYYDLPIPLRSLIILGFFLTTCVSGCLLPVIYHRKNLLSKSLVTLGTIVSSCLLLLYTTEATSALKELILPPMADWLCGQSILVPLVLFLLIFSYDLYLMLELWQFRRNTITRSSIKEGIDKISSGLCFYQDGGRTILVNYRMNELCFAIVGRDLQNAQLFWQILSGGETLPDVERLSFGDRPSFRLPDGRVWSFAHEVINGIHQLSAADTTQIQAMTDELKEKNIALAAMNFRLRKHGENVDELTRSKERLETKARIHSELGQALLSTRRYLLEESDGQHAPLEIWQRNIAMLRKEAVLKEEEQPLEMLSRIAVSTGIAIQIDGELPHSQEVQKLFVQAAAETLTNAISHAQAKTLYIILEETEHLYTVCFRNDGNQPQGPITEGGGLSSLRRKIEQEGGEMTIQATPVFQLIITLPKERGDIL